MSKPKEDPTLALIRERKLGTRIAARLGITRQAISLWTEVPWNRVLVVSEITGRPPHLIRPDIYPAPPEAPPDAAPLSPAAPGIARKGDAGTNKRSAKVTLA